MCFYTRTDYACGDWKWGNMKEQCPREHRMGETCGAKLSHIDSNVESPQLCRVCTEIATKQRRLAKARTDLARYTTERKLPALAAAKQQDITEIEQAIVKLNEQRISMKHLHSQRHDNPTTAQRYRPVPSITGTFYPPMQRQDDRHDRTTYDYKSELYRQSLST